MMYFRSKIILYPVTYKETHFVFRWFSIENVSKTQYSVENLKTKSSYRFRVFAVNEVGVSDSSEVTEFVLVEKVTQSQAPTIEKPLKDVIGLPNENVELVCIFGGIPQPKVTWLKDGKKLKTAKATYENRVATLVLTASTTTEGEYKCIAANEYGEVETTCMLEVQQKPIIEIPEEDIAQKHRVGEEWSVTATVNGIPKPEILWYRNGSRLEKSKEILIITEDNTSTVRISQLERTHTNKYTVEARNKAGSSSVEISLKVYGKFINVFSVLINTMLYLLIIIIIRCIIVINQINEQTDTHSSRLCDDTSTFYNHLTVGNLLYAIINNNEIKTACD